MAFAFGTDAYLAAAGIGKGLADTEAEAGALDKIVYLEETLEYLRLGFFADAGTGVFAVKVKSIVLLTIGCSAGLGAVAKLDVALLGVLNGIGNKIKYYLRHAVGIDADLQLGVGVIFDKLHTGLLNARQQRLEELVELGCEIDVDRSNVHLARLERRGG